LEDYKEPVVELVISALKLYDLPIGHESFLDKRVGFYVGQ
jgi:hypothetical protein